MTPQEALQILDQASALAPLNRQSHFAVQQASEVLQKLIQDSQRDGAQPAEVLEATEAES